MINEVLQDSLSLTRGIQSETINALLLSGIATWVYLRARNLIQEAIPAITLGHVEVGDATLDALFLCGLFLLLYNSDVSK